MSTSAQINIEQLPKRAHRKKSELRLILDYAKLIFWNIVKVDYHTGLIRFENGGVNINLYTTTFTVSTELYHPKRGKSQLHRKGLTAAEIIQVFKNA